MVSQHNNLIAYFIVAIGYKKLVTKYKISNIYG